MDLNRTVNVKNRSNSDVGYTLHDAGIRRNWTPGEIKKNITINELEQVTFAPGGKKLLDKYLVINDAEVCEYLGLVTEPEYFYDEKIITTLLKEGTLDQLLDCLDFAPGGVIDLIKDISVKIKLNSFEKRAAIKDKLGFDITLAIENVAYANSPDTAKEKFKMEQQQKAGIAQNPQMPNHQQEQTPTGRRTAPITASEEAKNSGRRTAPVAQQETKNKYNVVSRN